MLLLDCTIDGVHVEANGSIGNGDIFDPETVEIKKDDVVTESFGQTWSGIDIDTRQAFSDLVCAYVNDNKNFKFSHVCDKIVQYKDEFQSFTHTVDDRKFPDMVVNSFGDRSQLHIILQDKESGHASGYYFDDSGVIMTRQDGSVATDIEAFAVNSLIEAIENDTANVVYISDDAKRWLNDEYDIDLDAKKPKKNVGRGKNGRQDGSVGR